MDLPEFIHAYGYAALIVGTYFEGEVALAIGGCAARSGLLSLPGVLLAGGLGVLASDWTCFLIGRSGRGLLRRFLPGWHRQAELAVAMVDAHPAWFVLGFQFVPGTSTVTPIAIGMSRIPLLRFLVLDLLGVGAWTLVFGLLGYLFGSALAACIDGARVPVAWIASAVIVFALVVWWLRRRRMASMRAAPPPDGRACP